MIKENITIHNVLLQLAIMVTKANLLTLQPTKGCTIQTHRRSKHLFTTGFVIYENIQKREVSQEITSYKNENVHLC